MFYFSFQITHFSNDEINFNQDYLSELRIQCIRSKIFIFFIDRFALESNWFVYNYIFAKVYALQNKIKIFLCKTTNFLIGP